MKKISAELLDEIRGQYAQIDTCPVQGPRIFFENAGGALTLKKAVETYPFAQSSKNKLNSLE